MRVPEEYLPLLRSRQTKEQRIALAMLAKLNPVRAREQRLPHQWRGESRTFYNYKLPLEEDDRTQDIHELKSKGVSAIVAEHIHDGRLLQSRGERFLAGTLEPEDPTLLLAGSVELGHIKKEEEVLNEQHVYHKAAYEYEKALMVHSPLYKVRNVTSLNARVTSCEGISLKYLLEQFEETFSSSIKHQFLIGYDTQESACHFFSGKALVEGIPAETDDTQILLIYTAIHAQFSKDESCLPHTTNSSSNEKTAEDQSISQKTSIPSLT